MRQGRLRPDVAGPRGGIGFGQQALHRHAGEIGIAEEGVAIVEGEFDRFGQCVEIDFAAWLHRADPGGFGDVQRQQQRWSLAPEAPLAHSIAEHIRGRGWFDLAFIVRQIRIAHQPAVRLHRRADAAGDVALVEGVAPGLDRGLAVLCPGKGLSVSSRDRPHRAREIGLAKYLAGAGQFAARIIGVIGIFIFGCGLLLADENLGQEIIHDEAVRQFDRRGHHLVQRHRAVELKRQRHGIHHGRDRATIGAITRYHPQRSKLIDRGERRCRPLTIDDRCLLRGRVIEDGGGFPAKAEMGNFGNGGGEDGGHARIGGIAACHQYAGSRCHRIMAAGCNDAELTDDFGPKRFARAFEARRLWRWRLRLGVGGDRPGNSGGSGCQCPFAQGTTVHSRNRVLIVHR